MRRCGKARDAVKEGGLKTARLWPPRARPGDDGPIVIWPRRADRSWM